MVLFVALYVASSYSQQLQDGHAAAPEQSSTASVEALAQQLGVQPHVCASFGGASCVYWGHLSVIEITEGACSCPMCNSRSSSERKTTCSKHTACTPPTPLSVHVSQVLMTASRLAARQPQSIVQLLSVNPSATLTDSGAIVFGCDLRPHAHTARVTDEPDSHTHAGSPSTPAQQQQQEQQEQQPAGLDPVPPQGLQVCVFQAGTFLAGVLLMLLRL